MDIDLGNEAAVQATGLKHKFRISNAEAPLVFLVHGRAGNYDVMWPFRRAIPENFSIIAMQAPLVDPLGGWSWWEVKEGDRGEFDSAMNAGSLLRAFMDRAIAHYKLAPRVLMGFGFSQGAGLLTTIVQRENNPFDGIAMLAGFTMRNKEIKKSRDTKIFMAHGSRDETIPADLAKQGRDHFKQHGFEVEFFEDPVGHKIGPNGVRNLRSWVAKVAGAPQSAP